MPHIRHLYPGGNTSRGFYSYYDQLLPPQTATRIFILKGGPGVGKSTLMRSIGETIAEKMDVEFLHCSSDNDSLDGILVPSKGLMMVDGTAPHIVDPELPGAVDGIINLGVCLNETAMQEKVPQIHQTKQKISARFRRAYRYLAAASRLREDTNALYAAHTDRVALNDALAPWLKALFGKRKPQAPGRERKLFAGAVTPRGCVCTLESLKPGECWRIDGPWAFPSEWILQRIRAEALWSGIDVESYHCAIDPQRIEHLYLKQADLLITTHSEYHNISPAGVTQTLSFRPLLDASALSLHQADLQQNRAMFSQLLQTAADAIADAKTLHDTLEHFYTSEMDYTKLGRITEQVRRRMLSLSGLI